MSRQEVLQMKKNTTNVQRWYEYNEWIQKNDQWIDTMKLTMAPTSSSSSSSNNKLHNDLHNDQYFGPKRSLCSSALSLILPKPPYDKSTSVMSLASTLTAIGSIILNKLTLDCKYDNLLNENRITIHQYISNEYLNGNQGGELILQKLYNSILKFAETNVRCRVFGCILGWCKNNGSSNDGDINYKIEDQFCSILLDLLTRTLNHNSIEEQLLNPDIIMVPMVLFKKCVNFMFNGGLKHPKDLIENVTYSKKLTKKIKLLTSKFVSDIKYGGQPMIPIFQCIEIIRTEWIRANRVIPRILQRPGYLKVPKRTGEDNAKRKKEMPRKKKSKPGEDEEGEKIDVELWIKKSNVLMSNVQAWADELRLSLWKHQWEAKSLPPKDFLQHVPHPIKPSKLFSYFHLLVVAAKHFFFFNFHELNRNAFITTRCLLLYII